MVWFGEGLNGQVYDLKTLFNHPEAFSALKVLDDAQEELEECDLCLVVGTSSVVYPAAMFAPQVTRIKMHTILLIGFSL